MSRNGKQPYRPPQVVVYGRLHDLTQTSHGNGCDDPSNCQSCGNHVTLPVCGK